MKSFFQFVIVVLVTICMAEATCRIYDYIYPSFVFSNYGYNREGFNFALDKERFHLNSKGFNDIEHDQRKEKGIYRIVGIGDSFTFGMVPHKKNFLTILEQKLNQNGHKYEVVNMGVPAIGVDSFYRILLRDGLLDEPDMVIVCVYIYDISRRTESVKNNLSSYLYLLFKYIFTIYPNLSKNSKDSLRTDYVYKDNAPSFKLEKFLDMVSLGSFLFQKNDMASQNRFQKDLLYSSFYLKAIKNQCDKHRVKLLVVVIPAQLQVDSALQEQVVKEKKLLIKDLDLKLPDHLIDGELNKLGLVYIDLLEGFLLHSKNTTYYKPQDSHWNIAGNALAADLIYKKVNAILNNRL